MKIQYLIAIHLMRWLTNFIISASNEQQELEYTLLKPDCHSRWISKMQSGREDTLEERYAIKFCFKLGKNATETYGMLLTAFRPSFINRALVLSGIREGGESVRDDERRGRVRKSIDQSWLAKGLGLWLLCWGFKGVQEEITSEEASNLQIGTVAFPPGQCISPQLHPCHRLFEQEGHQDSSSPSLYSKTLLPVTFAYSLSSEAVVMRQLRRWKRLGRRWLTRSHKTLPWGLPISCWNGRTNALQPEEITSKGTRVLCVYYQ